MPSVNSNNRSPLCSGWCVSASLRERCPTTPATGWAMIGSRVTLASAIVQAPDAPPDDNVEADTDVPEDTGAEPMPLCEILSPQAGAVFEPGSSIFFEAELDDAGLGDLRLIWSSDAYGPMVLGNGFGFILPPGSHEIRVEGLSDTGYGCEDTRVIEVLAPPR